MNLTSTTGTTTQTWTFEEAVRTSMPPDGGLFWPAVIPAFPHGFLEGLQGASLNEIAYEVSLLLLDGEIPRSDLHAIIDDAIAFPAPVRPLEGPLSVLELFHGPTLAFKDFGARFLARMLAYLSRNDDHETTILVATSGDTGGAVAWGCVGIEGIRVVLLYPRGRVSKMQELQLVTSGSQTTALEVEGSFDDCQALVKRAFADAELRARKKLTTANSINFARLLPQTFYYIASYLAAAPGARRIAFSVPCGNLGNLTAGLLARAMGLPVAQFIGACNINDVLPEFLRTGVYRPRPSQLTLSNAMDIGAPSNLARIRFLFHDDLAAINHVVTGETVTDAATREEITRTFDSDGYVLDPHTAVACQSARRFLARHSDVDRALVLSTAHPSKFLDTYDERIRATITIPEQLSGLADRKRQCTHIGTEYDALKSILLSTSEGGRS